MILRVVVPQLNMLKNLFLDRDGVINEIVTRDGKPSSPRSLAEFIIRPEFNDFYKQLAKMPLKVFVVSNQPDVSRGLLEEETVKQIERELHNQFAFTEVLHCMHDDTDNCQCRKPKPGMISGTLKKYQLNPDEAIIIGDSYKDILAGKSAGIRAIYLQQSYNATVSCEPDYVVSSLMDVFSLDVFQNLS